MKQLEEQVLKADKDYFDSCKKLESARAEWDSNVYKVVYCSFVRSFVLSGVAIGCWQSFDVPSAHHQH